MLAVKTEIAKRTRFFVIEDDLDHQKIAEMTLHSVGVTDIIFFETGEEALEFFERSLASHGDHPSTAFNMGMCHLRLRRLPEARACIEHCLELDPTFDAARSVLIRIDAELETMNGRPA